MHTSVTIEEFSPQARTRAVPGFRFFDGRFPPRMALPSHYHERASIFVIAEGGLEERTPRGTFECASGTLLAKPAGERHSDQVSSRGARAIAVEFGEDFEYHRSRSLSLDSVIHDHTPRALALALQIAGEMRAEDSAAMLGLEGLALELAAHVLRVDRNVASAGRAPSWLVRIHDILRDGALGPLPSVRELAQEFGRHPAYVSRAFRRYYGCSIGACVRAARLDWAAQQLAATAAPISVIAMRAGFFDQSHFTRAFRKHARATPLIFRAQAGLKQRCVSPSADE